MKKSICLVLFGCLVVAQIAVPAGMIVKRERTLRQGEVFKFRTQPVDPYDAFRGRFVRLGFQENTAPKPEVPFEWKRERYLFAGIYVKEDGYAAFSSASVTPPDSGPYLKMKFWHVDYDKDEVALRWILDRFYMEEYVAPDAERAYRQQSQGQEHDVYASIRVLDGFAVIENLYINGEPLADYARSEADESS
jgi:uncharacterized membrane-anchored protein